MTDIENARANLSGHSICLCLGSDIITDDGKGISPMMRFIAEKRSLSGYSAADLIVGKAAALLFIKAGIREVFGEVMSKSALELLKGRGITCTFGTLTDRIINRRGDDICPMEKTVANINDPDEAYNALAEKLAAMRSGK